MEYAYISRLAAHIEGLIVEKRASGHPYRDGAYMLKVFDSFMTKRFPEDETVTKDAAYSWAERRVSEGPNNLLNRISQVRQLALYMNRMGTCAFVLEGKEFARHRRPSFRVLTPDELTFFFQAADAYAQGMHTPWQRLAAPVLLKTLYCLGLRPCEALRLGVSDVDTKKGSVSIYRSKGDKDRVVYMSKDLGALLADYDKKIEKTLAGRVAFFPNGRDKHYSTQAVRNWFIDIWRSLPSGVALKSSVPPLMSLRHTFATERIRLWASEGKDLRSHIYYLVEHMGHKSVSETEHYLHFMPQHFSGLVTQAEKISDFVIPEVI